MRIRLIGLGKMGFNLALNLTDHHHEVIGFDPNEEVSNKLQRAGVKTTESIKACLTRVKDERLIVWLLVPNNLVDQVIEQVLPFLRKDDIIIDGGNSHYQKSINRFNYLKMSEIHFVDVGTSGGTDGARNGACLMVGGTKECYELLKPVYQSISRPNGFGYFNAPGAGHFVKMIHNGIEYGMMQAIGEGFELMEKSNFELDYEKLCEVWNHGSIIASNLIGYTKEAFKENYPQQVEGRIDDSGEGKWMIEEALNLGVSLPVISASLFARFKSRDDQKFSEKTVASMRKVFGGHAVYQKKR